MAEEQKQNPNLMSKQAMAAMANTSGVAGETVHEIFTKVNNAKDKPKKIDVLRQYFTGQLHKHRMNVENYLQKSVGVGEHSDIMETVEKELSYMADYHDKIEVLNNYFDLEEK